MPLRNIDFEAIDEKRLWREIERSILDEIRQMLRDGWSIDEKTGFLRWSLREPPKASPDGKLSFPGRNQVEDACEYQPNVEQHQEND